MYETRIKTKGIPDVVPSLVLKMSIKRVVTASAVRMIAALVGISLLVYSVMLLPGLIILAIPGTVALAGKVYDEAKLIQFLRFGDPVRTGHWEDTENHIERIRIKASENRNISMTF